MKEPFARPARSFGRLGPALATLFALAFSSACGPALRFRPADTLERGQIEVGAGHASGGALLPGTGGTYEGQLFVRAGLAPRFEVGARAFTQRFDAFGGSVEARAQILRAPLALSADLAFVFGGCCALNSARSGFAGIDLGFSLGLRTTPAAVSPSISPHVLLGGHREGTAPVQIFLPVGLDVPIAGTPLSIRAEFSAAAIVERERATRWWFGGGGAVAVRLPDVPWYAPRDVLLKRRGSHADVDMRRAPPDPRGLSGAGGTPRIVGRPEVQPRR